MIHRDSPHSTTAWRRLIEDVARGGETCAAPDPTLRERASAAGKWVAPTADKADIALFGALGAIAYAYARAETAKRRAQLAPACAVWAEAAREVLDRAAGSPAAPERRYRADLDG